MNLKKERRELRAQRKDVLLKQIVSSKRDRNPLEIIIETSNNKKHKVAKQLKSLGKVTNVFQTIPYISLVCTGNDAEQIVNKIYRKEVNRVFEKSFRDSLNSVKSVDLSSKVSMIGAGWMPKRYFRPKEELWNLKNIGAYEAHKSSRGKGANIAIIDTGIDYTHSELKKNFARKKGYDVIEDNDDPMDENGHGTHVAGISAGKNCGVAPDATLYAVRVLDADGFGTEATVMAGIEWAVLNEINIANMSLGSSSASKAFEDICREASSRGLLLVAAAGNNSYGPNYPAAFGDYVIAVAAVDRNNEHASFSNIWKTNDISAPGVNIYSSYLGGGYEVLSGTSMAAPHISGALGLMVSKTKKPNLAEEVMYETAEKLESSEPYDNSWIFGAGLVRADKMMENSSYMRRISNIFKGKNAGYKPTIKNVGKLAWKIIW